MFYFWHYRMKTKFWLLGFCVGFGVRRPEWKVSCEFDKKVLIFIFKKAPGKRKIR